MAHLDLRYDKHLETQTVNGMRHYVCPNGAMYPSVTTVLSSHGKEGLDKWRKRIGVAEAAKITHQTSTLGTGLHNLAEAYIKGEELSKKNPIELARFRILIPTIDTRIGAVYALESALYSHTMKIAGRTDVIGLFDGISSVIDFKTGLRPKRLEWIENYFLQTAIYNVMFYERTKDTTILPRQLVILASIEGEREPQIFIEPSKKWIPKAIDFVKKYHEANDTSH